MSTWPTQNKYISQSTTRVDGADKVSGRARYSSDIQADGWLYGMILRSKWPAAKILAVDLDPGQNSRNQSRSRRSRRSIYRSLLRRGNRRGRRNQQAGLSRCLARHCGKSRAQRSICGVRGRRAPAGFGPGLGGFQKRLRSKGSRDGQCGHGLS